MSEFVGVTVLHNQIITIKKNYFNKIIIKKNITNENDTHPTSVLQTFLSKERYYTSTPMREAPSLSSGGAFSILSDSEISIASI